MNITFSILRLFLAVEDDILAFLRTTSKQITVSCSEFDKVGTIKNSYNDLVYNFWRPRAPPGFAVLGDYLTPGNKPPTKRVVAVNINFAKVKLPTSFKLIWPPSTFIEASGQGVCSTNLLNGLKDGDGSCFIWFPEAPEGYVALGCVVSAGPTQPPLSAGFCISHSLVSTCPVRDCVAISTNLCSSSLAFWRVKNSFGTFLPSDPTSLCMIGGAYELCHLKFGLPELSPKASNIHDAHTSPFEKATSLNFSRRVEAVASFQLIWWNRNSSSRKKISIWRPVVAEGTVYFGDIAVKGYEPPNTCIVFHDTGDEELFKAPLDYQLVGHIKKHRGMECISFWMPQAPPGFVSLGCIACNGSPKPNDFCRLRCMRSDMVTRDQFLEETIWNTSEAKFAKEPFSMWVVGNDLRTFIVRGGFRKPPRQFAMKLADPNVQSGSDDTTMDAVFGTLSASIFDDYGGLMVPLFNISVRGIGFNLHGRTDSLNSTVSFALDARSYNDKLESWEPLIEPVDGFLRYQYDLNAHGAASQLRFTTTRDLNLNFTVSNMNMFIQAYASWNNLTHVNEFDKNKEVLPPTYGAKSVMGIHQKKSYYIIQENKLGQEIFICVTKVRGPSDIIRIPSGDMKSVKVPVSENMLDSHLEEKLCRKVRAVATVVIMDAELPRVKGLTSNIYTVALCLTQHQGLSGDSPFHRQSARTSGSISNSTSSELELVNWNETFFFKVDYQENYDFEVIVSDMGKGDAVGFFSASLNQIAKNLKKSIKESDYLNYSSWIDLSPAKHMTTTQGDKDSKSRGRIKCAVLLSPGSEVEDKDDILASGRKSELIQISPSMEGPWTSLRLNYAAPAACWRFGDEAVASEASVKDGNRLVTIRSLVSVRNKTDLILDLRLVSKASINAREPEDSYSYDEVQTDEFFEIEVFKPTVGWVGCSNSEIAGRLEANFKDELPIAWEWIDDWHLDTSSVDNPEGWVYFPDVESLKWPESYNPQNFVNHARLRRWVRNRRKVSRKVKQEIPVGLLNPGTSVPLPLSGLKQIGKYVLQLRPSSLVTSADYSWSSVVDRSVRTAQNGQMNDPEICVSTLKESEELLYCTEISNTSSNGSRKLWFCVSIQAAQIAKDIHSDPILDWTLVVKSPLAITNCLPLTAEYSVFEMQTSGHFIACQRGILSAGKAAKVHTADIGKPLFFSLLPQSGWLPTQEAVLISHPSELPSKTISLRSCISGRIVQLSLERNYEKEQVLLAKTIRVYAPCWFSVARCPPLTYRLVDLTSRRNVWKMALPFESRSSEVILGEIIKEESYEGYTIASDLNFNVLGLSVSIAQTLQGQYFEPASDLSSLGDMDGSLDLYAYDADGSCMRLFISSKPCPYQSVPTKVISIRPFMTFTNRLGQDIYIKLSSDDEPKKLHTFDSRISFVYRKTGGTDKLQVRLEDTGWSFPVQITKEDTIFLVVRRSDGTRKMLRTEIRGFEEGSRFVVVFRLGETDGPIRIENRAISKTVSIRQSGFGDGEWIILEPLSTTNFSWEDPYGQKILVAKIDCDGSVHKFDLESAGLSPVEAAETGLQFHVIDLGDIKICRFTDNMALTSHGERKSSMHWGNFHGHDETENEITPSELIIELGVVGISVVDHRPKELSYFYLERVFVSYSTGYDGGTTSRFKLTLGYLQLDDQLPLSSMPVLLAPEQTSDIYNPVFNMTITQRNENSDDIQVYPYVYIKVTKKVWRLNVHEPIIWAMIGFLENLQLDRVPQSSSVTLVDPEIHVGLIDVSEIRIMVSLETARAQRPHGVLGVWSPILSAVGNTFKVQVNVRSVMHRDRFARKSSIVPAIINHIWRDLIHNPLRLISSVSVLGMTSSALASLSKGLAELSTDGQFLQLRSKQVLSRRITGLGDGIIKGTEALAQGVAFGVSGVLTRPMESARLNGPFGLANGLGRAFLGFIVQPLSGAFDFFSLTVDGIGASCSKCLEGLSNKTTFQRIRRPRAISSDCILRDYSEKEAMGQMILYLAEASRRFGYTEIFKEPSKFACSDYFEELFFVPYQRIILVSNKRAMLLQWSSLDKMDNRPSKIMWDVPWEDLLALELVKKAGHSRPSRLLLHLKNFRKSEKFARVIKCNVEDESDETEPQAVRICSAIHRVWKMYKSDMNSSTLMVPSSQRHVSSTTSDEEKFMKHSINFSKIWSSEREPKGGCRLCREQDLENERICSIWTPICPIGYVAIGDIAHVGNHPPKAAAIYRYTDRLFTAPIGYDLVWRNCLDEYKSGVSIWHPKAVEGFVAVGFVAVDGFEEPETNRVWCVAESMVEETEFDEKIWWARDSFPWECHIYQVTSDSLHFAATRLVKEDSDWKPMRVIDDHHS